MVSSRLIQNNNLLTHFVILVIYKDTYLCPRLSDTATEHSLTHSLKQDLLSRTNGLEAWSKYRCHSLLTQMFRSRSARLERQ